MKITRAMRTDCGASATCDGVHDTDDPDDVIVQGRLVEPELLAGVPEGETRLRLKRTVIDAAPPLLNADQLGEFLAGRHVRDLFRVETLDHYAVDSDAGEFGQFLRGEPGPDLLGKQGWLDGLRADRRAGKTWRYVHVLRRPLTPYLRYEHAWCYPPNIEAGMDVRILDLDETRLPSALLRMGDFFVVDGGETVLRMHYDRDNDFAGAEVVNVNPAVYVAASALLWQAAEPFTSWWGRHRDEHPRKSAA